jgi:catechol 2,3-dioxygenase-like lactoylglutathione lyase family enzyme
LGAIGKPTWSHGSYSCYFVEPGTNGWEIECYEAFNRKQTTAERFGAVKTAHWDQLLPEERFPGRGYVPQGFTHGTLVATDLEVSKNFYADVLGLDVHRFSDHVIYIKHPTTKTFVVCAVRQNAPVFSPNFRNTLTVASRDEVKAAYREFSDPGKTLPVSELFELKETDGGTSFCFRDHGSNCWELATTN